MSRRLPRPIADDDRFAPCAALMEQVDERREKAGIRVDGFALGMVHQDRFQQYGEAARIGSAAKVPGASDLTGEVATIPGCRAPSATLERRGGQIQRLNRRSNAPEDAPTVPLVSPANVNSRRNRRRVIRSPFPPPVEVPADRS